MFERHDEALFELLNNQGLVGLPRLEELKQSARAAGRSLADCAIESGGIGRDALLSAVAAHFGCDYAREVPLELTPELVRTVPTLLARERTVIPWRETGTALELLAADPFDAHAAADLTFALGREVRLVVGDPAQVERLIRRYYGGEDGGLETNATGDLAAEPSAAELETMAGQPPVIRFVNQVLTQAIRDKASDVHFEPFEREFKIRCRIDGVLYEMPPPPVELALPIASRIKVLANLDIAERRVPQDGRLRMAVARRAVDLRVSTLPTQFGESVVLRILDASAVQLNLDQLGMTPDVQRGVAAAIRRPHGIFVVTGPTSSGKTTTLYSGLRAINTPDLKLLTAEDPVEYEVDGIVQVPMNPVAGLTFAAAMRSFLRQDPDVIMIGEIRDEETARIAVQASLTGHLVLSTLHTNDAPGAVTRLLDLGVEPFLVASTVEAVLAQRLVRRICPECRVAVDPSPTLAQRAGLDTAAGAGQRFFRGVGCPRCAQSGYRGRTGIYEWLPMTDALRELVTADTPTPALRQRARASGMRTLREDGLRAAGAGETTLDEILKHT